MERNVRGFVVPGIHGLNESFGFQKIIGTRSWANETISPTRPPSDLRGWGVPLTCQLIEHNAG